MRVVTFISDFGTNDYYLSLIKGAILSRTTDIQLVEITNNVEPYDIVQAAFALRNTYKAFPKDSIHLVSVHNFYTKNPQFVAARCDDHYFVGPDNGVLSLALESGLNEVYELAFSDRTSFPLQSLYANAIAHIVQAKPLNEIGTAVEDVRQKIPFHPVTSPDSIRGVVIYVDNYENVITNISKKQFDRVMRNRPFSIYFKNTDPIATLSNHYYEVPIGEILALFNSAGFLEIAVNTGKASTLLGLKKDDPIQIIFN